jgi:hypothetical protein
VQVILIIVLSTRSCAREKGAKVPFARTAGAGRTPARRGIAAALVLGRKFTLAGLCAAAPLLAAVSASIFATNAARAEFKLHYPTVDYREVEFEHNGDTTFDQANSGKSNNQSYTNEVEIGALPFWTLGLEAELAAPPGQNLTYDATTFENTFQLTPQGKYWADLGLFAEYSHAASRASADSLTFGPLVQKQTQGFFGKGLLHTVNLLFEKEVGHNRSDDTPFFFAWQSRLLVHPLFEPGVEIFSQVDDIESPGKLAEQQHRAGPMFAGALSLAPNGKIKYEVGYLFGLTRATENGTVRWRLEYELPF